jgi:hypothetical protein
MMNQYDYFNQFHAINKNLESCLAIDCNLNGQYSSNSISSCSSTSSSATSIVSVQHQDLTLLSQCQAHQPDVQEQPNQHQTYASNTFTATARQSSYQNECEPMRRFNPKKGGMLLKHVKATFNQHECSSGDEGYVGSYSSSTSDNRLLMTKPMHSPHVHSENAALNDYESHTTTHPFVSTSVHEATTNTQGSRVISLSESNSNKNNLTLLLNALQANLNESTGRENFSHLNANERAKCLDKIAKDMLALEGYDLSVYDTVCNTQHQNSFNHVNTVLQGSLDEAMTVKVDQHVDEYNDDIANMNEFVDLECSSLDECEPTQSNVKIEIPNLFGPDKENEPLAGRQDDSVFFKIHDEDKFDIAYNLGLNEWATNTALRSLEGNNRAGIESSEYCCCHMDSECVCIRFKVNQVETKQLVFELFNRQVELEQLEMFEMYGNNWRAILDEKRAKENKDRQLAHEDRVDLNAYLNEIQMNVDYYQTDTDVCDDLSVSVDTLLRFRTNEMAFNLLLNHNVIERQRKREQQRKQQRAKHVKSLYADFDSIPEFVMPSQTGARPADFNSTTMNNKEKWKNPVNSIDLSGDVDSDDEGGLMNKDTHLVPIYADDENAAYTGDETNNYFDSTICGDESDNNINNQHTNGSEAIVNNNDTTLCIENQFYTNEGEDHLMFNQDDAVYATYDEFYDEQLYEDRFYIASLSDEEVLTLLRKESELYALKISQASKMGIKLHNEMECADNNDVYEQEPNFTEQVESFLPINQVVNLDTDDEHVEEFVSQIDEQAEVIPLESAQIEYLVPSSVDMFENVYTHYDEQPNEFQFQTLYDQEEFAIIDENTDSDVMAPIYETPILTQSTNEFDYQFMTSEDGNETSDHQMSLRNSLLRLRQSRRYLEHLVEQSKMTSCSESATASCSSASSTTGSFRTGSSLSLYKQHMLNMSKKPCVYILNEGRCMRSDCRFVHDLKTITCKYWLEGECIKGDNCEFAHELIHEPKPHGNKHKHGKQQSNSKKAEVVKKDFKLDSEEFPALGAVPAKTVVQSVLPNDIEKESNVSTTTKASVDSVQKPNSQTSPRQQTTKASIANIVKQQQQQQPAKTIASVLLSNVVSNKAQANVAGTQSGKTLSNIVKSPAVAIAQSENKSLTINNTNKQIVNSNNNCTTKSSNTPSGSENKTGKGKKNKKSQQKELLKQTSNSRTNSCTRKK